MKTTLRVLSISVGTLLVAAAPALAGVYQNHNETLVRDAPRKARAK